MWANILFPTHFLIGNYANQLPYFSRFFYFKIITSAIIWTEFKRTAHQSKFGDKTKQFAKGNLNKNRKITATVFDKLDISNEEDSCHQLHFFFTVNCTQTAGFVTAWNPISPPHGISCSLQFHNLWRARNRTDFL